MAAIATPPQHQEPAASRLRNRLLTFGLLLPAGAWYLIMLVLPLVIVVIYSFGTRAKNGGYEPAFVFDNYDRAISKADPFIQSLQMSIAGHDRLSPRGAAARVLPGDAGRRATRARCSCCSWSRSGRASSSGPTRG